MRKTVIDLDNMVSRPVIEVNIQGNKYRAILDTGAYAPVWVADEMILTDLLKSELYKDTAFIGGFGGKGTLKNVYVIDTIKMGKMIYRNVPVVAHKITNSNFQLVLPATMFKDMIYTIDNTKHKLSIKANGFDTTIKFDITKNGILSILLETQVEDDTEFIDQIENDNDLIKKMEKDNYL